MTKHTPAEPMTLDEIERLNANIARLSANPADFRYWEGRYRDEAAANRQLVEALEELVKSQATARIHDDLEMWERAEVALSKARGETQEG